jgi:hypothetical protein
VLRCTCRSWMSRTLGTGLRGLSRAGAGDRVVRAAARTWEQSLEGMQAAAEGALKQLRQIDPAPDEVKVSFGVAVNGKLGALLVTAGADAHLKVEVVLKAEKAAVFSSTRLGPTSSASLGPTLVASKAAWTAERPAQGCNAPEYRVDGVGPKLVDGVGPNDFDQNTAEKSGE